MSHELFSGALKRAILKELPVHELFATAQTLTDAGQRDLALTLYREWINFNQDSPILHAIYFNYGIILSEGGDLVGARDALQNANRVAPGFLSAYINLGSVHERLGAIGPALESWFTVVNQLGLVSGENINLKTMALKQSCRVLESINALGKAEEALRMSLDINPNQREVIHHWISMRQRQNKWPIIEPFPGVTRSMLLGAIAPLSLLNYTDDPMFQLATAHFHHKLDVGRPATFYTAADYRDRAVPKDRLRIGYVSSDMRNHAVGFLTSEIFELHDRSKVDVFIYYCGINVPDPTYERIKAAADKWTNITGMNNEAITELVRADQVDILIDLNGYTKDGPFQAFAMRPAPVIVNWLGYPGTLGTPCHHYIIADDYIIPDWAEKYYTEKPMRLPCYQPNDRKRVIAAAIPTRAEVGLPEDGTVFCSFNGTQKITSFTFARWMEILRAVPGSVLWLLKCGENSDAHLMELAAQHGVDPNRLVFADRTGNAAHVARYALADLFLDTMPYGAHTTASDALWMGLPVLTLPGRGFASRVCASLVNAAGVPEFICSTPQDYVQRAIEFGLDKSKLQPYRERLLSTQYTSVLFDTPNLVRSLEGLYAQMWDAFVRDELPQPDLTNMELYRDIGAELDHDAREFSFLPDYEQIYRDNMARLNDYAPIPADSRLWPGKP